MLARMKLWFDLRMERALETAHKTPRLAFAMLECLSARVLKMNLPAEFGGGPALLFADLSQRLGEQARTMVGIQLVEWLQQTIVREGVNQLTQHLINRSAARMTSRASSEAIRQVMTACGPPRAAAHGPGPTMAPPAPPAHSPGRHQGGRSGTFQNVDRSWKGCRDWATAFAGKGAAQCARMQRFGAPCKRYPCDGSMAPADAAREAGIVFGPTDQPGR